MKAAPLLVHSGAVATGLSPSTIQLSALKPVGSRRGLAVLLAVEGLVLVVDGGQGHHLGGDGGVRQPVPRGYVVRAAVAGLESAGRQ